MLWPNQISTASPHTHGCARPMRRFFTSWSLQDKTFKADVLCENGIIKAVGPDLKVRTHIEQTTDQTVSSDHAPDHKHTCRRAYRRGRSTHVVCLCVKGPQAVFVCTPRTRGMVACYFTHLRRCRCRRQDVMHGGREGGGGGLGRPSWHPHPHTHEPQCLASCTQNCPYSQHYLTRRTLCIVQFGTYMWTVMVFTWQHALGCTSVVVIREQLGATI
jgi:hypothetical protein